MGRRLLAFTPRLIGGVSPRAEVTRILARLPDDDCAELLYWARLMVRRGQDRSRGARAAVHRRSSLVSLAIAIVPML